MTGGVKLIGTSHNDELETPPELYAWLNRRFAFNYDAFASADNYKCRGYSAIAGMFVVDTLTGEHVKVSEATGLEYSWRDLRVYCNPPYSRGLFGRCIDKMTEEKDRAAIIVALVKVDASTAAWRRLADNAHIEFLDHIAYVNPEIGQTSKATFASAVAILRPDRNGYKGV